MKKKKILTVLILSLVLIALTISISYIIESRSQKLPAVVTSDKVFVSSQVDGVLKSYSVNSMQRVSTNDLIAQLENSKLPFKLETLKNEKTKYKELINSAKTGDFLKSELFGLDEDIQKNSKDLEEALSNKDKASSLLLLMNDRYASSLKKYEANKKLYNSGILNNSEFEKAAKEFWDVHDEYNKLKGDSLVASQTIKISRNIINLLKARKDILTNNVDMLASKHIIDLNGVEADLNDLEEEMKNLNVYSPIQGILTDLNYRPGEKLDKGDVIAEIADLSNVWVTAYGTSSSRQKVQIGQKVRIYCDCREKLWGEVVTVSPVMEKVKALSTSFETVNTYTKIEIKLFNMQKALKHITPGERLFVRIYFSGSGDNR